MSWIETFSGVKFNPLKPRVEDVRLVDIAHSLSQQCRYNGHTHSFYSVAEHSVVLTEYALAQGRSVREAMTVLLHDASEAYVGDMVRPLKPFMGNFVDVENQIQRVICEKFDLIHPFPDWLKQIDKRILMDERAQIMLPSGHDWDLDAQPLGVTIRGLMPSRASDEFERLFDLLDLVRAA